MRYLITGGAGFIGSHLAERLLARGDTVLILDDLSTGSIANVRHLKSERRFEYTIDSVSNVRLVAELVDEVDAVFHLAAAVGVKLIVESPARTIETNVRGASIVLAQADKKKRPVLLTSTSEVYGKSTDLPFRESGDLTLGSTSTGRWAYACSKAVDEFLALAYFNETKLPTIVTRLFNTAGPRQTGRYGMVLPRFVGQALVGAPLTVYGDGQQRRCFSHVCDVADALVRLMDCEQAYGQVVNVGSQEEISIVDLAHRVTEATESASELTFVPYAEAYAKGFEDMFRRIPDIAKIHELIGWKPSSDLNTIISDIIDSRRDSSPVWSMPVAESE